MMILVMLMICSQNLIIVTCATTAGRERGRGRGSQSSGPESPGIRNHEKNVTDIVVRKLKRAKPGAWGCIQAREVWSTEEETNMWTTHFWICKFGTVPGSMTCVERKFELQGHKCKWEEYKGTRYSDGDSALVVELWLHRVADDLSGLTFQEWDPSVGTDDTSVPVAILVNSRDLRTADFPLTQVRTLHLDAVARSRRPSYARRGSEKTSGCR
jgi:hypothetical protein